MKQDKIIFRLEQHPKKKGICPSCGKKGVFRFYENSQTGERLPGEFGRCDRENNCSYHQKPYSAISEKADMNINTNYKKNKCMEMKLVETTVMLRTFKNYEENNFVTWLQTIFNELTVKTLIKKYHVGTAKENGTIFWYIDKQLKIRTGKKMHYGIDGKRNKEKIIQSLFTIENGFKPCLFGEHLLTDSNSAKIVCVVESEKTAIVASVYFPDYIWLASGGANGLTSEKIEVLKNRNVLLVPDFDNAGRINYQNRIPFLQQIGCSVQIIDFLPEENNSMDIADYLVRNKSPASIENSKTDQLLRHIESCEYNKWMEVNSIENRNLLIHIMDNYINYIEFNFDFTKYRKINLF